MAWAAVHAKPARAPMRAAPKASAAARGGDSAARNSPRRTGAPWPSWFVSEDNASRTPCEAPETRSEDEDKKKSVLSKKGALVRTHAARRCLLRRPLR
eukprot:6200635-Pleurochrysis_carterae.AAC.2